ncbi:MAG: amidohydrolase family protein [Oscillospiraceae bacterium]
MDCDILILDGCLLAEDGKMQPDMAVAIKDTRIAEILPTEEAKQKYTAAQTVQAKGNLIMPGFVDAHTHTCQQLLRGRTTDEYPMIWTRFLVPFESNLSPQDVRVSAQLCCLEMIKAGYTAFADAGGTHMDQVAEVVIESGMRAALCRSTMDMGAAIPDSMKESCEDNLRHTQDLYRVYNGAGDGRVDIWYGLRQVMTCSPELVRKTGELAKEYDTGIHAHLCEHKDEVSFCLQNYKKRPTAFLEEMGVLGPNLLTAHNVTLSEGDITLMAQRQVKFVHCPRANLSNHGFPKTPRILECGAEVGIGCDGASGVALDMFDQLRILKDGVLAFWGLPVFDPVVLPTKELLKMASLGGAAAIGHKDELGSLEVGKKADVIIINIHQPHLLPSQNLANTLLAGASGRDVTDSIINGRMIMQNRQVLTLDEDKIMAESTSHMEQIIARAGI